MSSLAWTAGIRTISHPRFATNCRNRSGTGAEPRSSRARWQAGGTKPGTAQPCKPAAGSGQQQRWFARAEAAHGLAISRQPFARRLRPFRHTAGRTPRGHPEGLREAFANIYSELACERMALALGEAFTPAPYPRIADGAHTMAFIEACIASHGSGRWADVAELPPAAS